MRQKSLFVQLYLVLTLLLIPAAGIYEGLCYFAANQKNIEISSAAQDLVKTRNDLILHADETAFWLNRLTRCFVLAATPEDFARSLIEFTQKYDVEVEFATYSRDGKLVSENVSSAPEIRKKWLEAGKFLQTVLYTKNSYQRYEAMDSLRPLFGQHFFIPEGNHTDAFLAGNLYQSDFKKDQFRYWVAGNGQLMVVVRMPTRELLKKTGFRHFAKAFSSDKISFARFTDAHNRSKNADKNSTSARAAFYRLEETPGREFIEIDNHLFSRVKISASTWILIACQIRSDDIRYGYLVVSGLLLLLFCFLGLRHSGYFSGGFENLSLLIQICVLMTISAGIPLAILGSVAINYFSNKKTALIRERNQQMVQFALQIDRNMQIEHARYTRLIRQSVSTLPEAFRKKITPEAAVALFKEKLAPVYANVQIISTKVPGNRSASYRVLASDMHPGDQDIVEYLGKQHLAALNAISAEEMPAEKAYMLESIFQKSIDMIVHDLLVAEGNMTEAGWGKRTVTIFAQAFKVLTAEYFDHYIFISIVSSVLQENYIAQHLHGAIRNPWGFTFYVARDRNFINEQKSLELFPEINQLFMRTADFPLPEPEILDYQGEKHLFVGLKGNMVGNFKFCVLYPVARIDREISKEARELLYPAVLGGTIVLFMILILHLNLLMPVNRLHQAARALENRDASFRLPESKGDEFAEMATIFNASIAEFEELQIASIVQKRLLPGKPLHVKGFSIFGKCLPMVELGGDYFDYFPVDDDSFVLLLGDVAGHGVGASLLMAMA
ncbi:MAG: stage II sporulation E family protein, partial [uncultured bacterium]